MKALWPGHFLARPVRAVGDGQAALKRAPAVDLLVTDVMLPGAMNGFGVARRLQAEGAGVPVVYISGYPCAALAQREGFTEAMEIIQKPFRKAEIARVVRDALERRAAGPAGEPASAIARAI